VTKHHARGRIDTDGVSRRRRGDGCEVPGNGIVLHPASRFLLPEDSVTPSVIATLMSVIAMMTAAATGADMFRGNLQHTGVYADPGVPELHGVKWSLKTGGATR
jgi:hypothetical protein